MKWICLVVHQYQTRGYCPWWMLINDLNRQRYIWSPGRKYYINKIGMTLTVGQYGSVSMKTENFPPSYNELRGCTTTGHAQFLTLQPHRKGFWSRENTSECQDAQEGFATNVFSVSTFAGPWPWFPLQWPKIVSPALLSDSCYVQTTKRGISFLWRYPLNLWKSIHRLNRCEHWLTKSCYW